MSKRTVDDWRRLVFRSTHIGDPTRVVLLYLADHMKANRRVSVPREQIAKAIGKSERRVSERIAAAHEAGLLRTDEPGYRGHTAVYEALFGKESGTAHSPLSPTNGQESGTHTSPLSMSQTRPLSTHESGTDGGPTNRTDFLSLDPTAEKRSKERGCFYCTDSTCDGECLDQQSENTSTTDDSRRTA